MGLPGQRRTKTSKRKRASHFALKKVIYSKCPKCQKPVLSHHACSFCGTYKGRAALEIKTKLDKKARKKKEKEEEKEARADKKVQEKEKKNV